jgi:TetR/AcrR family transcriptional regulator, transcriptional repressor of bet genes
MKKVRTRIEDVRRVELIAAAHRVFMRHGLNGMTTARICAEAGMSPGILAYYFKGKDEVLLAMVRHNNRVLAMDVAARLKASRTRWDRLLAILEGNFPAEAFEANVATAWLSVCAIAPVNPFYGQLQKIFYRRLHSNLASVFLGIMEAERLSALTLGIGTMIDGLWLRKSISPDLGRMQAVAQLTRFVTLSLTQAEREKLDRPATEQANRDAIASATRSTPVSVPANA